VLEYCAKSEKHPRSGLEILEVPNRAPGGFGSHWISGRLADPWETADIKKEGKREKKRDWVLLRASPITSHQSLLTLGSPDHPFAIFSGRDAHRMHERSTESVSVSESALPGDLFGKGLAGLQ
jgi:hypothetical protein